MFDYTIGNTSHAHWFFPFFPSVVMLTMFDFMSTARFGNRVISIVWQKSRLEYFKA
jgi:hypothetical protein